MNKIPKFLGRCDEVSVSLAPVVIAAKMHSNLKRFVSKEGASSSGVSENSLSCSYGLGVTDITGVGLLVSLL